MTVVRFIIFGVLNTLMALAVFAALQWLISDYRVAGFVAVPICVLFSHATMGRFVFNRRGFDTLLPFAVLYAILGSLNAAIISATVGLGHDPLLGQMVAAPFVAILSFLANNHIIFRRAQ